ncbi:hypothetical protein [Candidatus Laterigemmans baculatus]|uniref:hypothetical protein n=1 Tax=Candidatus Laterigemmans baculatus TaxID=2770505 RepID=UPI0013DB059D|nr:hypothetical protein [Candidatus Laterigemmans baculatus]
MHRQILAVVFLSFAVAVPTLAQPAGARRGGDDAAASRSLERWLQQLENELEHLQEDLYFQRGSYPAGLRDQVERASQAVAHFHHEVRRSDDREHWLRDFREMDERIHELVESLNRSSDPWLQRQALRISYPDEQIHYALRRTISNPRDGFREVLARHARVLENEARNLEALAERVDRRDDRMRREIRDFADEAEDFREEVERDEDFDELREDFQEVDEKWHQAVDQINRSATGLYLRRTAQNVNRVHNQIFEMLNASGIPGRTPPADQPRPITPPRDRYEGPRDRPGIEIELPRIGRFRIPF